MTTKMPYRLEQALHKLYVSFHNGTLQPECACNCATGTICDNKDAWKNFTDTHGSLKLNYVGMVNQSFGRRINGYLPSELLKLEAVFLQGCGYELPFRYNNKKPSNPNSKEIQFNGLCAAIGYLCELDAVDNVMDLVKVFKEEIKSTHMNHLILSNTKFIYEMV